MNTSIPRVIENRNVYNGSWEVFQLENFRGGSDYEMFLEVINNIGIQYDWTEEQILRTIELKLTGKARKYYGALQRPERPKNMHEMKQWFRRVFGKRLSLKAGKRELARCTRVPGETLGEYAHRLRVIVNKIFPVNLYLSPEKLFYRNLLLVEQFIAGLETKLANEILRKGEFYHPDSCLAVAEECEEIICRMLPETAYSTAQELISPQEQCSRRRIKGNKGQRRLEKRGDTDSGQLKSRRKASHKISFTQKYPYMKNRCCRCGDEGHSTKGCWKPKIQFCYHCGKIGKLCDVDKIKLQDHQQ